VEEGLFEADWLSALTNGCSHVEEFSQDWKESASEDGGERETLSLRQVSETKSETCKNSRSLVLSKLLERGLMRWPHEQIDGPKQPTEIHPMRFTFAF